MIYKRITIPWIGKFYKKGINGKKLLALGESHHCDKASDFTPDITIEVIRDLFDPNSFHEPYKNTFAKFINSLAGEKQNIQGKEKWWDKIAFYNYIQKPIPKARQAPTSEDFKKSEEAFFDLLEQLRPTHIIAWGKRLFNNLPNCGKPLSPLKNHKGKDVRRWEYRLKDGTPINLIEISHPSSGYATYKWHGVITQFLSM